MTKYGVPWVCGGENKHTHTCNARTLLLVQRFLLGLPEIVLGDPHPTLAQGQHARLGAHRLHTTAARDTPHMQGHAITPLVDHYPTNEGRRQYARAGDCGTKGVGAARAATRLTLMSAPDSSSLAITNSSRSTSSAHAILLVWILKMCRFVLMSGRGNSICPVSERQ